MESEKREDNQTQKPTLVENSSPPTKKETTNSEQENVISAEPTKEEIQRYWLSEMQKEEEDWNKYLETLHKDFKAPAKNPKHTSLFPNPLKFLSEETDDEILKREWKAEKTKTRSQMERDEKKKKEKEIQKAFASSKGFKLPNNPLKFFH